ncbi:MAG: 2-hydroxyacid dehydrogenase [Methylotenera sp.]|nr:2-hydroxyacid dehydrogenase [Methylotenera sp.]MDP2403011.1 2-hydroxyacid dehydrogenase [Methylotenera sp.]MDP3095539.1 2-hydroxyacid dehydrogenase [Methylotenera sp.]MDZ4223723.1 2-hydroxyacid dehydrogenase [Methylotenera sp.]
MRVAVFSTKPYDKTFLEVANAGKHQLVYLEPRLDASTAFSAEGAKAVCVFVNDQLDANTLAILARQGVGLVALRCAGFNNVDLVAAEAMEITVARVPEYSPHSVAEHAVALMLTLNRKIHRASARVREGNFSLEGLLGFDMHGKTVGVIGTGKIGLCVTRILSGFGCKVLAFDPYPDNHCVDAGAKYVTLPELFDQSDIVSLHCPLTPQTHHLIDEKAIKTMRPGVMLINISRGAVVDTRAIIRGLKSGMIGSLGLDVYEEEENLFFRDLSSTVIHDDVFARLLTFPNVLITGHQAFFTHEAVSEIARTTLENISSFEDTGYAAHPISVERLA